VITVDGSSSTICSINAGVVSFNAAGSCVLNANQAGTGIGFSVYRVENGAFVEQK
jgi:hypothetical protein